MAQFLRPAGNVTQSSFTGGFAEIDEATASDSDWAWGADNTAAVLEVSLSDPSGTPGSGTCTVRYRIARTNDGVVDGAGNACTVTGEVYEGGTQVATDTARTATGTWTEYSFTFAASAVTDWTDLRLRFTTSTSGGSPANRRGGAVSWAEVETPDAASPVTASPGVGAGTWAGFAATVAVTAHVLAAPGAGVATWAGHAPTVAVTNHVTAAPGTGAASWAGFAPTVTVAPAGGGATVTPGVGQATWAGQAPTVTVTAHVTAAPGVGAAAWAGHAPTITATAHVRAEPGVGAAVWGGLAPTVTASDHRTALPGAGTGTWAGHAPTVTVAGPAELKPVTAANPRGRARYTPVFTGGRSHGRDTPAPPPSPAQGGGPTYGGTFGDGNG